MSNSVWIQVDQTLSQNQKVAKMISKYNKSFFLPGYLIGDQYFILSSQYPIIPKTTPKLRYIPDSFFGFVDRNNQCYNINQLYETQCFDCIRNAELVDYYLIINEIIRNYSNLQFKLDSHNQYIMNGKFIENFDHYEKIILCENVDIQLLFNDEYFRLLIQIFEQLSKIFVFQKTEKFINLIVFLQDNLQFGVNLKTNQLPPLVNVNQQEFGSFLHLIKQNKRNHQNLSVVLDRFAELIQNINRKDEQPKYFQAFVESFNSFENPHSVKKQIYFLNKNYRHDFQSNENCIIVGGGTLLCHLVAAILSNRDKLQVSCNKSQLKQTHESQSLTNSQIRSQNIANKAKKQVQFFQTNFNADGEGMLLTVVQQDQLGDRQSKVESPISHFKEGSVSHFRDDEMPLRSTILRTQFNISQLQQENNQSMYQDSNIQHGQTEQEQNYDQLALFKRRNEQLYDYVPQVDEEKEIIQDVKTSNISTNILQYQSQNIQLPCSQYKPLIQTLDEINIQSADAASDSMINVDNIQLINTTQFKKSLVCCNQQEIKQPQIEYFMNPIVLQKSTQQQIENVVKYNTQADEVKSSIQQLLDEHNDIVTTKEKLEQSLLESQKGQDESAMTQSQVIQNEIEQLNIKLESVKSRITQVRDIKDINLYLQMNPNNCFFKKQNEKHKRRAWK